MPRCNHPHFMESIEGPQVLLAVAPDRRTDGQTGHFWETTISERRRQIDLQEENAERTIVYFGVASSARPSASVRPLAFALAPWFILAVDGLRIVWVRSSKHHSLPSLSHGVAEPIRNKLQINIGLQ